MQSELRLLPARPQAQTQRSVAAESEECLRLRVCLIVGGAFRPRTPNPRMPIELARDLGVYFAFSVVVAEVSQRLHARVPQQHSPIERQVIRQNQPIYHASRVVPRAINW